jgi:hypothetical protein
MSLSVGLNSSVGVFGFGYLGSLLKYRRTGITQRSKSDGSCQNQEKTYDEDAE